MQAEGVIGFQIRSIKTAEGVKKALVATPKVARVVGRERLMELRRHLQGVEMDNIILGELEHHRGTVDILVFQAREPTGEGIWAFTEDLAETEAIELGYLMVKSHMPIYRRLILNGGCAMLHTDLTPMTYEGMTAGTRRLVSELESRLNTSLPQRDHARYQIEAWLLRHLTFYFKLGANKVLEDILPGMLPMLIRRTQRMEKVIRSMSDNA